TPVRNISSLNGKALYKVFNKYQNIKDNFVFVPSNNFVYVPDMNEAFHVTKNTLFKITLQCGLFNRAQAVDQFVQIIVDDYLIMHNSLLPNTDQRLGMLSATDSYQTDRIGGYYHFGGSINSFEFVTRMAMVYLPPGTYTFNVGVRSSSASGLLGGGMVTYELTQFDYDQDLGDLKLATFPK
ncbi:unnamed protein product, partial [Didymodactylos carnosus]